MSGKITYHGDDQEPNNGNTLVMSRDGGGDFLLGVLHQADGVNYGTSFVRFRRANGGASKYPRLVRALAELEAALAEVESSRTVLRARQ